ncbi:L,D-transpeptidase family protein [Caenibacillus caldisaponilyticus]|uniref:L,D-transpeptidase family protein n=1 Tax=Caenibacillus caldisaponilyticus TaxID=1674942 RepID=UPI000988778E|nr:L,D-transpeptidase family protein [Caenibacillus caldisaponilyticus]
MNVFKKGAYLLIACIALTACNETSIDHQKKNAETMHHATASFTPSQKNMTSPTFDSKNDVSDETVSASSTSTKTSVALPKKASITSYHATFYLSSSGNIRSGAGTNYSILDVLTRGKQVHAFEKKLNGKTIWYHVHYGQHNQTGWVSSSILTTKKPSAPNKASKPSAVVSHSRPLSKPSKSKPLSTTDRLLNKVYRTRHATQAMIVTARSSSSYSATLSAYQYRSGHWTKVYTMIAVIGKRGITFNHREGDMRSPAGIFDIGKAFGTVPKPSGVKLSYKMTTKYDYWVDDVTSSDYNKWIVYKGDPKKRWKSFERLRIPAYKYAMIIRFNMDPIIKGRGSAIFLHVMPGPYTAGCTAVSEANMLKLLKWVSPSAHPVIIQGTQAQLSQLSR